MSTRAQVKINGVYLYQHCDGYNLTDTVMRAINSNAGKSRQDDPEYLTRIIFCEMVKDDIIGATGYGIGSQQHCDIDFLVIVDCDTKTVNCFKTVTTLNSESRIRISVYGFDGNKKE